MNTFSTTCHEYSGSLLGILSPLRFCSLVVHDDTRSGHTVVVVPGAAFLGDGLLLGVPNNPAGVFRRGRPSEPRFSDESSSCTSCGCWRPTTGPEATYANSVSISLSTDVTEELLANVPNVEEPIASCYHGELRLFPRSDPNGPNEHIHICSLLCEGCIWRDKAEMDRLGFSLVWYLTPSKPLPVSSFLSVYPETGADPFGGGGTR